MKAHAFDDVLIAFSDAGVRFVVTGGVAIALHGLDRPVADLDLVVDPAPDNLRAVAACLARLGLTPTLPLPLDMVVVMRTMDARGREVDVNRIYPIAYAALLERAAHVGIGGRSIPIASKEDLIAVKRQRARDYDLADVRLLESE
jgi:predicted nucleotidyltransferase